MSMSYSSYNIVFFGSPQNSADLLRLLDRDSRFKILAAVTQPDRPAGRGRKKPLPTPVAKYAESKNIPVLKPKRHPKKKYLLKNQQKLERSIAKIIEKPNLILSYEYGQLIPEEILSLADRGGLNIHFSLLPSYAGPAPLPWQILNNEKYTGISIIEMTEKFDKGKIIYQEAHKINPNDTTQTLHKKLSSRILKILPDLLVQYLKPHPHLPNTPNLSSLQPQTSNLKRKASYAPRLTRQDGYIPWQDFLKAISAGATPGIKNQAAQIHRKLRALSPWPGVWTLIEKRKSPTADGRSLIGKRLKILSADLKNGKLLPLIVQLEGRSPQPWPNIKTEII